MTVDHVSPVAAWSELQATLRDLEDGGYRVPCLDLVDLFVSDDPVQRQAAVPWCLDCPARTACNAYAVAAREPAYVWGGVDRAPRMRGEQKRTSAVCETALCQGVAGTPGAGGGPPGPPSTARLRHSAGSIYRPPSPLGRVGR